MKKAADTIRKNRFLCLAAFVFVLNMIYLLTHHWQIDSDMSIELILAKHMNLTGSFAPADWHYTTEVRVFHIPLIARLFFILFGEHWFAVRTGTMTVLFILYLASAGYAIRQLGLPGGKWALGVMLLPFGSLYWFLSIWGGHYLVYPAYSLFAFGLILDRKKGPFGILCLVLLAFLTGLNGVKQTMVFYTPMLVSACYGAFRNPAPERKKVAADAAFSFCVNLLGIMTGKILFDGYSVVDYQNVFLNGGRFGGLFDLSGLLRVYGNLVSIFGGIEYAGLFSFAGIAACCGILLGFVVLAVLVKAGTAAVRTGEGVLENHILWVLLIDGAVFAWLNTSSNASYWLPQVPFILILLGTELEKVREKKEVLRLGLTGLFLLTSAGVWSREWNSTYRARKHLKQVTGWLVEQGFRQGYADFWLAGAMTEFSDGKLDVWSLSDYTDNTLSWGQPDRHFQEMPEKPYFILMDEEAYGSMTEDRFAENRMIEKRFGYVVIKEGDF